MKKIILCLVMSFAANGFAEVISVRKVILPVDVSRAKVRWSNLGYDSIFYVKIIVPELAGVTLLNHRNEGESGPCLFTREIISVDQLIQNRPEVVNALFEITHSKEIRKDLENSVCKVTLNEDVKTVVRGIKFTHSRSMSLPDRHLNDCY